MVIVKIMLSIALFRVNITVKISSNLIGALLYFSLINLQSCIWTVTLNPNPNTVT